MEWLRIQLGIIRERGMKAMLIGHVPPARVDSKESWDETCWQKLTLWERQYRDVIIGSFYGHMNIDHFMLHDFKDLKKSAKKGRMSASGIDDKVKSLHVNGEVTVESASDYLMDLGDAWAKLPTPPKSLKTNSDSIEEYLDADEDEEQPSLWARVISSFKKEKKGKKDKKDKNEKKKFLDSIGGKYASRFSVAHVSPSVVPNYFPTLRVFSYNISGLEDAVVATANSPSNARIPYRPHVQTPMVSDDDFLDDEAWEQEVDEIIAIKTNKKEKDASKKKKRKYKFKVPDAPSKSSPPGPAYSPQTLSLVGYVQYFANLTHINHDFVAEAESLGGQEERLDLTIEESDEELGTEKWKEGKHSKHQGKRPRPKPHPRKFKFEVEYNTTSDRRFKLKDLTVRSYVDLARRIGQAKEGKKSVVVDEDADYEDFEDINLEAYEGEYNEEDKELDAEGKGKKKKHKKGHAWYTFIRRAFVDTMDPRDIEQTFGVSKSEGVHEAKENMEL
jgi:endopolyphosphatase